VQYIGKINNSKNYSKCNHNHTTWKGI